MHSLFSFGTVVCGFLLADLALAAPAVDVIESRASTCQTASNRACWSDGFNINTDYEASTPPGQVRTFNWEVTEKDNWTGPDGVMKKKVMLINNQYPGPTLVADWGDTIVVNLKNSLLTNGTSIHWHGMRQFGTNIQDGANGVTECPLAPGHTKTYRWKAEQYGTSWYHSHFSAQYGNGVVGSILINGPASLPYDIDLGVFPISDYYYNTADEIVAQTMASPAPPPSDNVMFNGTNINPKDPSQGKYANVTLTPGKRHRLRLINPSVENNYQVSLVGHQFTVIATDMVPVNSFTTSDLFLGVGQRYDVTIDASQPVGNYWFNVTFSPTALCGLSNNPAPAAIFHYEGASGDLPTTPGTKPADAFCQDRSNFSPVVSRNIDLATFKPTVNNNLPVAFTSPPDTPTVTWFVNKSAIDVSWDRPVLEYIIEGNTSYPASNNLIKVDEKDVYTFWVIQNLSPLPHPMHLHGHDFLVLGRSNPATSFGTPLDTFESNDAFSFASYNPTRRDVTMLPGNGWLVVAFKADNPGSWLFHCHIAWHVSGGLSVNFLERASEQKAFVSDADKDSFQTTCRQWNDYYATSPFKKLDSGL